MKEITVHRMWSLSRLSRMKQQYDFIKPTTRTLKLMLSKHYIQSCLQEASDSLQDDLNTRLSYLFRNHSKTVGFSHQAKPYFRIGTSLRKTDELTMSETSGEVQQILVQKVQRIQMDDGSESLNTCFNRN